MADIVLATDDLTVFGGPESISLDVALSPFQQTLNRAKPYALVLRSSPWGEYSCVVVKREVV